MKFTMITILTAAFITVASSAAIEKRANPLPARFGLVTVSDYSDANGFRARYTYGDGFTFMPSSPEDPVEIKDVVLRGGAGGHVVLDSTVHPGLPGYWDTTLGGDWELIRPNYWSFLQIYSKERLAILEEFKDVVTGGFVEYGGLLRPTGLDGEVLESKWVGCGTVFYSEVQEEQTDLSIEWDPFHNTLCPHIEFKIVEL